VAEVEAPIEFLDGEVHLLRDGSCALAPFSMRLPESAHYEIGWVLGDVGEAVAINHAQGI